MKINISKDQYRVLLDMLHMAEQVVNSQKATHEPVDPKYGEVAQSLYAHAEAMGFDDLIAENPKTGRLEPTWAMESDGVRDVVKEHHEDVFWNELVHRLTLRDVNAIRSVMPRKPGETENILAISKPIKEKYLAEFSARGLKRLSLPADA